MPAWVFCMSWYNLTLSSGGTQDADIYDPVEAALAAGSIEATKIMAGGKCHGGRAGPKR